MTGSHTILVGDVLERLRELPDSHFHCVVTSPPFWGLRNYGVAGQLGLEELHDCLAWARREPPCAKCHVCAMRRVFAEVRRVLRDDGVLWLEYGDSYTSGGRDSFGTFTPESKQATNPAVKSAPRAKQPPGLKPKDLCGVPWRVALALQADGWYLRSDIIWHRPNPMPESVTDRATKSHSYIFMLTKQARYYFDQEAVKEKADPSTQRTTVAPNARDVGNGIGMRYSAYEVERRAVSDRNLRSVWTICTQPFPEAHFATFPEAIPDRCIRAGTSERGCCPKCGKGWVRQVESERRFESGSGRSGNAINGKQPPVQGSGYGDIRRGPVIDTRTLGWSPACSCGLEPVPSRVLDPFGGSGTTVAVACQLGRDGTMIELNPEYAKMAEARIGRAKNPATYRDLNHVADAPLFGGVA